MWREGIHAIGIVDNDGKLIGTLSSSDLRGLTASKLQNILKSPCTFIKETAQGKIPHPVTCHSHDVLEEVMLKAVTAKVHRVWMIDAAGKPTSVVSLSDIIANFVEA
jgi:CBS-domain-containing membrane protein